MAGPWDKYAQAQQVTQNPMFPGQLQGQGLNNTGQALQNAERGATLPYAAPKARAEAANAAAQAQINTAAAPAEIAQKQANARQTAAQAKTTENNLATTGGANETQAKSASFYTRAFRANQMYEGTGIKDQPQGHAIAQSLLPEALVNAFTSESRQKAEAAQRDFISATLRYESGAAISPSEFENQRKIYFPEPGDSPQKVAAKAQLRKNELEGMRVASGPAAPLLEPDMGLSDNGTKSVVDQARTKGLFGTNQKPGAGEDIRFNDAPDDRTRAQHYRDQFDIALRSGQLKTRPQVDAWVNAFNQQNGTSFRIDWNNPNSQKALDNAASGKQFTVPLPLDAAVDKRVQEIQQKGGTGGLSATGAGAADVLSVGLDNKLAAGLHALGQAFNGSGKSFGQNYATNLDADRQYEQSLQQAHPNFYLGGQLAGGLASTPLLPGLAGARTLPQLSRAGAVLGGIHGYNSADGNFANRLQQGIEEAGAGAAVPAALFGTGRAIGAGKNLVMDALRGSRGVPRIPPLVDPMTGELNQPLQAMNPAQRMGEFNHFGLNTITPGMAGGRSARVIEQGFNNLPGSAGLMEDVNSAASGELRKGMSNLADQFGNSRTLNEGGAELQRGATEYMDRAKTVIGKAYSAIPISDTAPAAKTSTIATLQNLTGRFASNPKLAEALHDPKLAGYLDAFQNGNISWKDLKDFRSIIGEKIGDMRFGESSSTSDLRALYGALSEDMRSTASAMGPKALNAFERANTLNRQNEELIQGSLTRILGKNGQMSPERAAAAVHAMTAGGKASGDLRALAQIKGATVKSGAWDEIASTLIRLGGQPANSEGRAFQPQTFVQWYSDMSQQARNMLFKPELRNELDRFVAVNQQLSRVKGLANTSGTTPTMIGSGFNSALGVSAVGGLINPTAWLGTLGLVAGAGANNLMARAWTNPAFVRWATGYSRALASGSAPAVSRQVSGLTKLATTNPELRQPIENIFRSLANDNAPKLGTIAASPNQGPQQGNQPQY